MKISQKEAITLLESGKAGNKSFVWSTPSDHELTEPDFIVIDRFDLQRVDHYSPTDDDIDNWAEGKDANGDE